MFNKIKTLNVLPRWIIIVIDLLIFAFSALAGYLLRLNFSITALYEYDFIRGMLIFTISGLISSLLTRSFAGIIRYTGIQDTIRVLYANLITLGLVTTINTLSVNTLPYSITLIAFFVSLVLSISYRLLVKELFAFYRTAPKAQKKILIFGAGNTAMITKQLLDNDTSSNIKVVGFLEDNKRKIGNVIAGVKIFSAREDFGSLMEKSAPTELIIAKSEISLLRKNELVDLCLAYGVKVSTVPTADKWIGGAFDINQIQEVNIEDLLGRNVIVLQNQYIAEEVNERVVLVTGAAGSIGTEIARQLIQYQPSKLILLDQSETGLFEIERELKSIKSLDDVLVCFVGDISNQVRMRQCMKQFKPAVIFHAAAYKHVPLMELNVEEAFQTNILGTQRLADLAVEFEVDKFVMISTDKAVNPTSIMGATKRAAEIYVQSLAKRKQMATKFVTTRFGNVLGSNGSVIPIFKKQIQMGGPITVTHPDINRYFMTIPEACSLVLEAGTMGHGGEIFVFDMGESVKIVDLARRMIQLSGLEEGRDIHIEFTGLRPGEKLYEELLNDEENTLSTHHPKIMIAKTKELDEAKITYAFGHVQDFLNSGANEMELVKVLKELVSEYKSQASRFEYLDQ
jgi:FlaA1/EpsC-like NDP-sugar epimerase